MNSKISFRKVAGENFKQKTALLIFFAVVGFLTFPLFFFFTLQSASRALEYGNLASDITYADGYIRGTADNLVYGSMTWGLIFCVIAAVISAITMFVFLHSKEKSDFFQSLGLKRHKMYLARWFCGLLAFLIPYIANVLVSVLLIMPLNGAYYPDLTALALKTMGLTVLGYAAIYTSCVLAVVLTGRVIVSLIIMAMIFVYAPVCAFTLRRMIPVTYDKIYLGGLSESYGELLSPVGALIRGMVSLGLSEQAAPAIIALSVWAAAAFTLGLIVYRFRPSEAAGRAMSFGLMKPIVKIAFGIVCGLAVGTLATEFVYHENGERAAGGWFWFWSILTLVLVQIILEAVYNKDLKSVIAKWKSFLIMLGGLIAAALIVFTDPFGINSWFPKKEDVARMSVANMDLYSSYGLEVFSSGGLRTAPDPYSLIDPYFGSFPRTDEDRVNAADELFVEDFEGLYELAEKNKDEEVTVDTWSKYFGFELKNGTVKHRRYNVSSYDLEQELIRLSESDDFKERFYPAFNYDFSGFRAMEIDTDTSAMTHTYKQIELTGDQLELLTESYKNDCRKLSLANLGSEMNSFDIYLYKDISKAGREQRYTGSGTGIFIYPGMNETIEALSKITGVNVRDVISGSDDDRVNLVESVDVYGPFEDYDEFESYRWGAEDGDEAAVSMEGFLVKHVTDKEVIKKILAMPEYKGTLDYDLDEPITFVRVNAKFGIGEFCTNKSPDEVAGGM